MNKQKLLKILVTLLIIWNSASSTCSSESVYPMLFGTGTWDLFINDMKAFANGDIIIGGKSYSTKAAGEGFVIRIDQYGTFLWKNLYISTAPNEDSVDAVNVFNNFGFAVGHSLTGSVNQYFILKIALDGSIQYNYKIGIDTTIVGTNSVIIKLVAYSESSAQIYFDGYVSGVHNVILSNIVMDGITQETLVGLKGYTTSTIIQNTIISTTAQTIFWVLNNKLFAMYYDSTSIYNTQASYLTNELSTIQSLPKYSSMDLKSDLTEGWIAAISTDSKIYGVFTNIAAASSLSLARCFQISGFTQAPTSVVVNYIDSTHWVISAFITGNSGYVILVDQSTTSSPVITMRSIPGLNNGVILVKYLSSTSSLLIGSNIIGGESSTYTKTQGIIYKSANNFAFTTYNCYNIITTVALTISQYSPIVYVLNFLDLIPLSSGLATSSTNQI